MLNYFLKIFSSHTDGPYLINSSKCGFTCLPILFVLIFLHFTACGNADHFGFLQTNLSESNVELADRLQIADDTIILELGSSIDLSDSVALRAAEYDEEDLVWFINNTDVLTQTSTNTFRAKSLGTTTVKASAGLLAKTITVLVIEPKEELADVSFSRTFGILTSTSVGQLLFDLEVENESFGFLTAKDLQTHLECPLQFSSDAPDILSVDEDGVFMPLQNGFATLTVRCGEDSLSQELLVEAFRTAQPATTNNTTTTASDVEDSSDNSEPALSVTFHLETSYSVGEQVLLKADLQFASGMVYNVTTNYVTPLGESGQISWNTNNHASINNGVIEFEDYGVAEVAVFIGRQSFVHSMSVSMNPEDPINYEDRFLGYDDFPGYESWTDNTCPVVDFGDNGGYATHLCPEIIMNPPYGNLHVVSLGSGGSITLELNGFYPVDADGPDFTIFENPLLSSEDDVFAERAKISVSQNGRTFYDFECEAFDIANNYPGCAGVNLVNIDASDFTDPADTGGDSYDLADLGLSYIRYIRITDMQTCVAGDPTYDSSEGWELCNASSKEGFDLDALVILNGARE